MQELKEEELVRVLLWAKERLHRGDVPPWTWENWKKIADGIEALLSPDTITLNPKDIKPANLHEPDKRRENGLQLVDGKSPLGNAQHH